MSKANLGPSHDDAITASTARTNVQNLMTRNPLQAGQIGSGGLLVNKGGSITIQAPGTLNLGGGVLSVAASIMAGTTISAGTSVTAGTSLNGASLALSGNGTAAAFVGNDLYTLNGPGYNITGGRVTAWLETATGRVGMATSSERFKVILGDGEIDVDAVLALQIVRYQYKAEVAKRDDPESEGFVGPDYFVRTEIGLIAEHLDAAGLREWVFYESDEVTPMGIHYGDFVVPLLAVAQAHAKEIAALRKENDDILARLQRAGL